MSPVWPHYFQPDVVREAFGEKLSSYVLALEAWRRGLDVTISNARMYRFRISDGSGHDVRFVQSRPHLTSRSAHLTAKNKHKANHLMEAAGVPVPKSVLIDPQNVKTTRLIDYAIRIGFPVVLKPRNGAMGEGVFANIEDSEVLARRYEELTQRFPAEPLLLERHCPGDDYRVLVFGGHFIAACKRVPANVTGDGRSSVRTLIALKNRERRANPFLSKGLIKTDQEVSDYLARHGYNYSSVPRKGEYLRLRSAANASAGGDVVDVTEELPESIQESAVRALAAVPGLHCAGVDVLFKGSQKTPDDEHVVLELNSQPQLGVNMYPTHGAGVDVARKIIDICFPNSPRSGNDGDARLGLHLRPVLAPLASGHAREVTLPAVSSGRFPVRRLYTSARSITVSSNQRARILRASERHSVSGFIRHRGDSLEVLASGTREAVESFALTVTSVIGSDLKDPQPWNGLLFAGFKVGPN